MGWPLSLKEEQESGVVMPEGLWQAKSYHYQLCLVGRLLVNRIVRFEALSTSLQGMLNSVKGMEIHQLDGGWLLLKFNHIIDRNRVLEGCPWSFEKNIMILRDISKGENPIRVDLEWCEFFVHVYDLPLSMNEPWGGYIDREQVRKIS
ncbi:UNVERIFIED_CONTAM: hypothetical protein Scaly_0595300 [Sesamum calycinum]|uniref:DUF4283 domain-containing protein n=1 Tax=Sesamum calycinum TaxID=2727403 RepID=A0AAW2RSE8_9LAMI